MNTRFRLLPLDARKTAASCILPERDFSRFAGGVTKVPFPRREEAMKGMPLPLGEDFQAAREKTRGGCTAACLLPRPFSNSSTEGSESL
jgi:hypothetical protein